MEIPGVPNPVKKKYIVDIVGRLGVILLVRDAGNNNTVLTSFIYNQDSRILTERTADV